MKKNNIFMVVSLLAVLLFGLSACNNSTELASESTTKSDSGGNDSSETNEQPNNNNTDNEASTDTSNVAQIKGKSEYLQKLDNIQKELDALPEKEDSDKGVTNAMKSYYGVSYEKYDQALNEVYALLQEELSPETMDELKAEQQKWIEEKEEKAKEESKEFEGGTLENVSYYISLYESTKERCYELVNKYMTD